MPGDHDFKKKKKELKEKLAKINDDNTRGDVDKDKDEQYKSIGSNEYYNKHDADMGGYNKDILDKVQLKNKKKVKKGKKVPQDPTLKHQRYMMLHHGRPMVNYDKELIDKTVLKNQKKVKKADLSDITKEQKKKKGKERLVHKASKGVDTYSSQDPKNSKVKKKHVKGKISKQLTALRKKVNKIKNNPSGQIPITHTRRPPQGPSGGTADTPESIIKDAEAVAKTPSYIAKDHDHTITFKGYKGAQYKRASLISNTGKYAKYWLLNAKQTNGNGWGVSQQSIAKNIHKFVGKPLVVTAKSWIPDSEYGDAYEHPYLPTNDINKVFDHQEKFRVGSIVDIIEKDGDYFANIELNQKFAHMVMPPFCSPAIFQNNPSEPEGQIEDWEALHLAALHEDPAYGSRIALLRGTCVGTKDQCTVQFKAAKQEAKMVCTKGIKERLSTLTAAKSPTGYLGDASVDIPWGEDEVNITFRDMAQFHRKNNWVNKQGTFPQIWNLGQLTGEGQGAREIFDAAHDVENRFVEEMGAENYQKNMQGEIDHLVKEYGEDPEGDLSYNEELTRTQDNLGLGDDVSESRRNEIKRRQTKERLGRLKKNNLKSKLAGRWNFTEGNPDDKIPAKDIDKKYGPRGDKQEIDETANEITYMLSDKGLGVRQSPLEHDFEANIHNTDSSGRRIQDTDSMQGPLRHKGMISYSNAVKWSKLKQRIAGIQRTSIEDVREMPRERFLGDKPHTLHKRSTEIEEHGLKSIGESPTMKGSHFLTTGGKLMGNGKYEHRSMSHSILKNFKDKDFNSMAAEADGKQFSRWGTDGRNMGKLLEQTGMARISGDKLGINIDSKHPLTKNQMAVINQWTEDNNIGPDNIFIDDDTPGQDTIRKQLRLPKIKSRFGKAKLNQRLAAVGKAKRIKLHKDSYGLEQAMIKGIQEEYGDFTDMGTLSGSHFLTTDGVVVGSGGDDHRSLVEQAIQRHSDKKLRKMLNDPKMDRTDLMHEFMKQSGLVRINGSSRTNYGKGDMSFSTFHPLSSGQRRFLNSHIENSGMSTDNIAFDDMSDDQSVGRQLGLRGEYDDENTQYAKLKQRLALEGGVGGVRKYWLYPDGKISEDVRWHDKLHFNDEGQMRDKGGVKITNEQGKYDNYFGVGLRQHLTPAQKSHIKQELKDYGFYRNKGNVTFDHGDNKNNTVDSTTKDFGDGFAHSYEHNQKPIGSEKISNLKQRIAAAPTTKINQKDGETIANAYDKMLHNPNDSAVKESYNALIGETNSQFNELKKNGLRIDPIKEGTNPYQSADDLHNDLKKNNHIYYYPSEKGFGSGDNKFGDHPLLSESPSTYKGKKLLNNDVFRIVHDVNGHNLANSNFSPEGEHNAFLQHRKMYSPLAGKALFTETAAQANWGTWNKKSGASNRKLIDAGRVNELEFADQKAGLLSDDIINTEWHTGETRTGKLRQRLSRVDISESDKFHKRLNRERDYVSDLINNKKSKAYDKHGNIKALPDKEIEALDKYVDKGTKIRPPKPTQKDRKRIISAKQRLGRLIKGKQRNAVMSKKASQIVNSFKQSGFDPTGTSGVWDAQNSKNLNAYEKPDLERIWDLYGRRGMGFNSVTNTIKGPNNDIGLIAKQLTEIEEHGGIPALGFDNGSLEAVNVTYGTKDEVLNKLLPHQNSTGYIDEDGKLDVPPNPRYQDYLKGIDKKQ